jgi:Reverse transcriptase (RNA-dependent DNA polymerase)
MQKRKIQLIFNSEISSELSIEVGVPQGSPISAILFLIYTRYIFELAEEENNQQIKELLSNIRILSYIDDIAIVVNSKTLKENSKKLELIAERLFNRGKENFILFDQEKIELIHFYSARKIDENEC